MLSKLEVCTVQFNPIHCWVSDAPTPCPHPCWLLRHPCYCTAATSHSLNEQPLPRDAPPPVVHFSSLLPLVFWLVVMLNLVAPPPPCVTFCRATISHVHPLPPAFTRTGWFLHCISLRCICLLPSHQHRCLSTHCCLTLLIVVCTCPAIAVA